MGSCQEKGDQVLCIKLGIFYVRKIYGFVEFTTITYTIPAAL